MQYSINYYY